MTMISRDDVEHLADLSSLQMGDDELAGLGADIENILTQVTRLDELDTEGIEPTYQVTGLSNVYRDDEVDPGQVAGQDLVELAPESLDNQIKVPKVL